MGPEPRGDYRREKMSIQMNWDEPYSAIDVDSPRYDHEYELYAALEDAETCWGEVTSQHLSEVSLAGDSWPGAVHDIDRAFRVVVELRKKLGLPHTRETRRTADGRIYQVWGPVLDAPADASQDIPF
jgi:hypothetical protein